MESMTHGFMQGIFCPACGQDQLRRKSNGTLRCTVPDCTDPDAAQKILADPEIHHIVRFDEHGYFNVQHPLRERIDGALLDCKIYDVVRSECEGVGCPGEGPWRIRPVSEHNLDANWVWEPLA